MDSPRVRKGGLKKRIALLALTLLFLVPLTLASISISPTTKLYGGTSAKYGDPLTNQFTITNDFTFPLTDLTFEFLPDSALGLSFIKVFENLPTFLNTSNSSTFNLKINVPEGLNAVDTTFDPTSINIGDLKVTVNDQNASGASATAKIKMQVGPILSINRVELDYQESISNVSGGGTIHVIDGDDIRLRVYVKNTHSTSASATPIDFEDSDVTIEVSSDELDFDETESLPGVLQPGEVLMEEVRIEINDNANRGSGSVEIIVSGVDEHGALHASKMTFTIDIDDPPADETTPEDNDYDDDGIDDDNDACLGTPQGCSVDEFGCHQDDDGDGICNGLDSDQLGTQENTPQTQPPLENPVTQTLQQQIATLQQELEQERQKEKNIANPITNQTSVFENATETTFIPFLVGLLIGAVLTTVFFLIIR